jgi:aldehyde:ferredoxin oxidoreductase
MYSISGKVAWINLSNKTVTTEPTEIYKELIGGRAVGGYLLLREVSENTHPLSPENILTFNTGPLTGTLAPSAGRINISTKNVATNGISFANAGGYFGPEMKYAGLDHLIIQGKAEKPVYLFIHDNQIEVRSAEHLWGKDTWETEELIKRELKDEKVRVAAIGQAGENLVTMACIMFDRSRASGWGGCGAVMGSKNLKAVAVRGKGYLELYDSKEFMDYNRDLWKRMLNTNMIRLFHEYGNLGTSGAGGIFGNLAQSVRNMEDEIWEAEKTLKVREVIFKEKYEQRKLADFTCPIICSRFYHIKEGKFSGHKLEALKTNIYRAFGTNIDLDSREYILMANEMADRYGMNCDSLSASIAWAIDIFQRGLIDKEITDGLDLHWGDGELQLKLFDMIAFRKGFGDVLANGVYRAAQNIGRGTEKYAMHAKGHGICEQGMRSHKGWALGIITSSIGGGHLAGAPNTEQKRLSAEIGERYFGVPTAGEPTTYIGKGKLVSWFDSYKAISDIAGVCVFATYWIDPSFIGPDDFANLISSATGEKMSGKDLLNLGEKICNIEKAFNTLHAGFTRKDDFPPYKLTEIPISSGEFAGEKLSKVEWEKMLDEYYKAHQWDVNTGLQTRECLLNLGLHDVRDRIEKTGKFPPSNNE